MLKLHKVKNIGLSNVLAERKKEKFLIINFMKICRLYLSKTLLISYFLMFIVFTFLGIAMAISPVINSGFFGLDDPPWPMGIVLLGVTGWVWYAYLRIPFEIKVIDDNTVEFRSLLKRTTISPKEIKSIKAWSITIGFLRLKHSRGTIHLLNQMDNFHEFISFIKTSNPSIEIRGC